MQTISFSHLIKATVVMFLMMLFSILLKELL